VTNHIAALLLIGVSMLLVRASDTYTKDEKFASAFLCLFQACVLGGFGIYLGFA